MMMIVLSLLSLLNAKKCEKLAKEEHLILLCGHYEGIDERAIKKEVDEEISIGDYVLTNGCAAAIIFVDAVARFVPGVIGHPEADGACAVDTITKFKIIARGGGCGIVVVV